MFSRVCQTTRVSATINLKFNVLVLVYWWCRGAVYHEDDNLELGSSSVNFLSLPVLLWYSDTNLRDHLFDRRQGWLWLQTEVVVLTCLLFSPLASSPLPLTSHLHHGNTHFLPKTAWSLTGWVPLCSSLLFLSSHLASPHLTQLSFYQMSAPTTSLPHCFF